MQNTRHRFTHVHVFKKQVVGDLLLKVIWVCGWVGVWLGGCVGGCGCVVEGVLAGME